MKERFYKKNPNDRIKWLTQKRHEKILTKVKNKFSKKTLSRKTILMTVSMVVQRKHVKKQTVKTEKNYSFYGRPFLHEITPNIASTC